MGRHSFAVFRYFLSERISPRIIPENIPWPPSIYRKYLKSLIEWWLISEIDVYFLYVKWNVTHGKPLVHELWSTGKRSRLLRCTHEFEPCEELKSSFDVSPEPWRLKCCERGLKCWFSVTCLLLETNFVWKRALLEVKSFTKCVQWSLKLWPASLLNLLNKCTACWPYKTHRYSSP